jgi:hypothetical protein
MELIGDFIGDVAVCDYWQVIDDFCLADSVVIGPLFKDTETLGPFIWEDAASPGSFQHTHHF